MVSSAEDPVEYDGPESLEGHTLCHALGYQLPGDIDELIDQEALNTTEIEDMDGCARMVELGRVDFFIPTNFTWPGHVESEGLDPDAFHVSEQPVEEQGLYFITARTDEGEQVLERFDEGLRQLRDTGRYEEIVTSHVGDEFDE